MTKKKAAAAVQGFLFGEEQSQGEAVGALQGLINSGQAWRLEGSIGRAASDAISSGLCALGNISHRDYWGNYVPSRTEVKAGTKGSVEFVHAHGNEVLE